MRDGDRSVEVIEEDQPQGAGAPNGRRPGARQVARRRVGCTVVRKIDAWSVLKLSVVFYLSVYCILVVAGVLLWTAATVTGLRHNVESFIADLIASGRFHFVGGELFRAATIGGAALVVMGSAANVMFVVLYNLLSDLVGGLTVVVEERPLRIRSPRPTAGATAGADRPIPAAPMVSEDELRTARPVPEPDPAPTAVSPSAAKSSSSPYL